MIAIVDFLRPNAILVEQFCRRNTREFQAIPNVADDLRGYCRNG
jgi:hypothetical protein